MVTLAQVAYAHQERVIARSETATRNALKLWGRVDVNNLDGSWDQLVTELMQHAQRAQVGNAHDSNTYMAQVVKVNKTAPTRDRLVTETLIGVDGSGRPLESLLHGAITTTKERIGAGAIRADALLTGASYLAAMLKTALADTARQGDMVAAAGKTYTHYVRVVNAGACSRCAILAGKSSYEVAFKRHPSCHCTAAPITSVHARTPGLFDTASEYFASLTDAEQSRIFTDAGADAIRAGADPAKIVSARRSAAGIGYSTRMTTRTRGVLSKTVIGYRSDRTPILGYVTSDGATRRGQFGRLNGVRVRLMPETIMALADGSASTARVLLRDAGYIDADIRLTAAERLAQRRADRVWADRIYRSAGYTI